MINSFSGEYRFLSNFYPAEVTLDGQTYPTVEHAYQASKTWGPYRNRIRRANTPGEAKRRGRTSPPSPNWESRKLEVMYSLVRQKFSDPELAKKLVGTGIQGLVEDNHWGDTFWGVCSGKGENHLGKTLMKVRYEVQTKTDTGWS